MHYEAATSPPAAHRGTGKDGGSLGGTRRWLARRRSALAAATVAVVPVLASCSAATEAREPVVVLELPTAVRAPVWSRDTGQLLALAQGSPRIVKIDPSVRGGEVARSTVSADLSDAGENLALSPTVTDVTYLPQPALGRVAVVDIGTLRPVATVPLGSSPAELAVDAGTELLYGLSADGSTVTGAPVEDDPRLLPPVEVDVGSGATLEGPERGRSAEFFVAGSGGVALYEGRPRAEKTDSIGIPTAAIAGDLIQVTRVYVGEQGTDRLLAVGLDPESQDLTVLARARLGAPVRYLGVDETRVYAATADRLVVLATNSFEGFPDGRWRVVASIDYRRSLPPQLVGVPLSGLAVGPTTDRVYLTLQDQPYLLSIAKPDL